MTKPPLTAATASTRLDQGAQRIAASTNRGKRRTAPSLGLPASLPPARSLSHALERLSLLLLVGGVALWLLRIGGALG